MYTVAPAVIHVAQVTQYDCWHASLTMMRRWRYGATAQPGGTRTNWLYSRCREAQNGYDATKARILANKANPDDVDRYRAGQQAAGVVANWSSARTLDSSTGPYSPFTNKPGLTLALLPTIFAENRLRAVRGACVHKELKSNSAAVEAMLRAHGPLYCLVDFGHVVVVIGVHGDMLTVCDPLLDAPSQMNIAAIKNSPCVARLA